MSERRVRKQSGGARTLEQISNRIYYVKKGYSTGRFVLGKAARGTKICLELITPSDEDESGPRRLSVKEALKKEYNVKDTVNSSVVQVPMVLIGARVKVHFVN